MVNPSYIELNQLCETRKKAIKNLNNRLYYEKSKGKKKDDQINELKKEIESLKERNLSYKSDLSGGKPFALPPHGLFQSLLNIPQHVSSPSKTSLQEFDAYHCKRIEDRVEFALSKVDLGLTCLQPEIQVKERLR